MVHLQVTGQVEQVLHHPYLVHLLTTRGAVVVAMALELHQQVQVVQVAAVMGQLGHLQELQVWLIQVVAVAVAAYLMA
jgi:hypothetical protein